MRTIGDRVRTWWDDGCFGGGWLYGRVVACGPKSYVVEWDSGIRNRIRHNDPYRHEPEYVSGEEIK